MLPSTTISPESNDVEAGNNTTQIPDSPPLSSTMPSFVWRATSGVIRTQSSIRKVLQPDETVQEDWDSDNSRKILFYFDKLLNDTGEGGDDSQESNLTYRIKKKVNPGARVIEEVQLTPLEERLYYGYMCLQAIRRLRRLLVYISLFSLTALLLGLYINWVHYHEGPITQIMGRFKLAKYMILLIVAGVVIRCTKFPKHVDSNLSVFFHSFPLFALSLAVIFYGHLDHGCLFAVFAFHSFSPLSVKIRDASLVFFVAVLIIVYSGNSRVGVYRDRQKVRHDILIIVLL